MNKPNIDQMRLALLNKGGIVSLLRKHGRPAESDLDAMRKLSNGHRVFVAHEQDEAPREIKSVSEMHGYTPDQIYTVAPHHEAKGGSAHMNNGGGLEKFLKKSKIKQRVYHGTGANVMDFKPSRMGAMGPGVYVTTDPEVASGYANVVNNGREQNNPNVLPLHIQARNPFTISHVNKSHDELFKHFDPEGKLTDEQVIKLVKKAGHDAIHAIESGEINMLDSRRIKSAIGNRGTYDTNEHDIIKADGGQVDMDRMRLELMNKGGLSKQERRANRKKFMEPSKDKRRFYHGSKEPNIVEFKTRKQIADENYPDDPSNDYRDERNAVFLSPDPKFTRHFSVEGYTDTGQAPTTYPVHVQARNPFDFDNPKHRENLWKTYHDIYYNPESELYAHGPHDTASEKTLAEMRMKKRIYESHKDENNWPLFENPNVQEAIQDMGHDSFYIKERGTKNLGVYDPRRIKSAIGNRGTYDINEPDINKKNGGITHAHHLDIEERPL